MFQLIWALSVRTRYFLRRYMPTNILLDAIRTRRGLRWRVPAMALAIPYLYAASICAELAEDGGPGWLHLFVMLFIWDALKMAWIGPMSVFELLRVRIVKRRENYRRVPENEQLDTSNGSVSLPDAGPTVTAETASRGSI
jgi:hypothetical protein